MLIKDAKLGETIRQKGSIDCWLVIAKTNLGLQVVNLSIKGNYSPLVMISQGQADSWELDINLKDIDTFEKEEVQVRQFVNGEVPQEDQQKEDDASPVFN